jgi:methionine biosynthesis protein MetW
MKTVPSSIRRLLGYPVDWITVASVDYDAYWRDKRKGDLNQLSDFQRHRAEVVCGLIDDGATVLDVGCGNGAILNYLRDRKGIRGIGVDVSRLALDHVRNQGFEVVYADFSNQAVVESLPGTDYVLALEVIEHLSNAEAIVAALVQKANKTLILSIPNSGYFMHRLRLLLGRFPVQWRLHPGEHLRFWTLPDARWWVKAMGLHLLEFVPYEGVPVLNRLFPSWFAAGLVMSVRSDSNKGVGQAL